MCPVDSDCRWWWKAGLIYSQEQQKESPPPFLPSWGLWSTNCSQWLRQTRSSPEKTKTFQERIIFANYLFGFLMSLLPTSFQKPAPRRNKDKDNAARQRRMTSFSRDPMFVIPAPYSGRPVCVGLVGMKRYQGAEDGCFLQKKSDTTSCLRSISSAKYLNSSVELLESSRAFSFKH